MKESENVKKSDKRINTISQIALPGFTILGYALTAMKYPEIGLIVSLIAQPFRFYSAWQSYKKA